jgi:hypothetical protein
MADLSVTPTRGTRTLVWASAALVVTALLAAGLFVVSQVFRALGESFCIAESRIPADAAYVSGPTFVDPIHLRCDYGDAGSRVFTSVWPSMELALVVGAVLGGIAVLGWCARQLTASPRTALSGKVDT